MANTNIFPQGLFGPGIVYVTRTDVANSTPVNVGYANEFQIDVSFETKQLFGQNQFPLLAARGTAKCTGKIKAATLSGIAFNNMLTGGTFTTGTQYDISTTAATAIPGTPFQITPTVPSTGTWDTDLGVIASTGYGTAIINQPLVKVASSPATGQYSVAAGVYTFAAADTGFSVIITFAYKFTSGTTGQFMTLPNFAIGTTPTFQLDYKTALYGATYYLRLYSAIASKTVFGHKLTDFMMPEYDFEFFQNASGNIFTLSLATTS